MKSRKINKQTVLISDLFIYFFHQPLICLQKLSLSFRDAPAIDTLAVDSEVSRPLSLVKRASPLASLIMII